MQQLHFSVNNKLYTTDPSISAYAATASLLNQNAVSFFGDAKMQYVDHGYRSITSGSYTGRLDKQVALLLANKLSAKSAGSIVVSRADQYTLFKTDEGVYSTDNKYYKGYSALITKPTKDDLQKVLMSGISFSPYIGVEAYGYGAAKNIAIQDEYSEQGYFTGYSTRETMVPANHETHLGYLVDVYLNEDNGPLNLAA